MKFNPFGNTGLSVSEIGFGGSRIGGFFAGKNSSIEAVEVLRSALEGGITFYDTADMYAQGESESLIGNAFRGHRNEVVLATKGGYCIPSQRNMLKPFKRVARPILQALRMKRAKLPARFSGTVSQDFSPSYLGKALESSLKRLRTDYVDLYQLHSPPQLFMQSSAFGDSIETLETLKRQGKIRFYGVATEAPEDASICLAAPGISSVQLGFGVLDLEALEHGTLAAARARGLAVIARGCFGGGLLKDDLDEAMLRKATPKWERILSLRQLSNSMNRPLLESALQFCRGTPAVSVTLLGMRATGHLRDTLRHYRAPPLSAAEYAALAHSSQFDKQLSG